MSVLAAIQDALTDCYVNYSVPKPVLKCNCVWLCCLPWKFACKQNLALQLHEGLYSEANTSGGITSEFWSKSKKSVT